MTSVIIQPDRFYAGIPNRVRVFSNLWLAGATFSYNGGPPVTAWRDGLQTWAADITPPAGVFAPATVDATATFLAGGTQVAPQVSVTPQLRPPLVSTGTVIPAAGAVAKWGDFNYFSGSVVSDGASVLMGTSVAPGQIVTPATTLNPGHTIVTVFSSANPIVSNGRTQTRIPAGCGLIQNFAVPLGGVMVTQVFDSAGAYVNGVSSAAVGTPFAWHTYGSNRDPGSGLTRVYVDGALSGSLVIAATQVPVAVTTYAVGYGDRYRFAGVWADELTAADFAQLQIELAPFLV